MGYLGRMLLCLVMGLGDQIGGLVPVAVGMVELSVLDDGVNSFRNVGCC